MKLEVGKFYRTSVGLKAMCLECRDDGRYNMYCYGGGLFVVECNFVCLNNIYHSITSEWVESKIVTVNKYAVIYKDGKPDYIDNVNFVKSTYGYRENKNVIAIVPVEIKFSYYEGQGLT